MTFEEEDRPALIRKYAKYLAHYHANDENMNGPGFGDVDFGPIFQALRDIDYKGYMSVEVFKFELGPRPSPPRASNTSRNSPDPGLAPGDSGLHNLRFQHYDAGAAEGPLDRRVHGVIVVHADDGPA